jgi:ABC-2 type transport system permease protein
MVRPRLALVGWLALAYCAVVMLFGDLLQLPGWAMDLSPFEHLPAMPADPFDPVPVVVLLLAVGVLGASGLGALRRRDLG